jgi:hypothetical protein
LRRGIWVGDKLRQIIMHQTDRVSSTSTMQRVLKDISSATNLVWRMSRRVLRDWAGCVLWHILEDAPQSLDDVVIIDFSAGHPRRVIVARVLVPKGIMHHQRLYPPLHEAKGHVFGPQPGFSQSPDVLQQLG